MVMGGEGIRVEIPLIACTYHPIGVVLDITLGVGPQRHTLGCLLGEGSPGPIVQLSVRCYQDHARG